MNTWVFFLWRRALELLQPLLQTTRVYYSSVSSSFLLLIVVGSFYDKAMDSNDGFNNGFYFDDDYLLLTATSFLLLLEKCCKVGLDCFFGWQHPIAIARLLPTLEAFPCCIPRVRHCHSLEFPSLAVAEHVGLDFMMLEKERQASHASEGRR